MIDNYDSQAIRKEILSSNEMFFVIDLNNKDFFLFVSDIHPYSDLCKETWLYSWKKQDIEYDLSLLKEAKNRTLLEFCDYYREEEHDRLANFRVSTFLDNEKLRTKDPFFEENLVFLYGESDDWRQSFHIFYKRYIKQ